MGLAQERQEPRGHARAKRSLLPPRPRPMPRPRMRPLHHGANLFMPNSALSALSVHSLPHTRTIGYRGKCYKLYAVLVCLVSCVLSRNGKSKSSRKIGNACALYKIQNAINTKRYHTCSCIWARCLHAARCTRCTRDAGVRMGVRSPIKFGPADC